MDEAYDLGFRRQRGWLIALAFIVAGQAGLALELFGSTAALGDDRPILSGRHPLHLYHAKLGAETFRQRYATACYDPCFQAGYPKTPVFDGGCRLAEFVLVLIGRDHSAMAYKIGLFTLLLMIPLAFAIAARGAGISAAGACLAAVLGIGVGWSPPVRSLIDAGDCDVLLAGLCALVFVAWLSRYNWEAGPLSWFVIMMCTIVGMYAHPVVWIGLLPVVLVYYVVAAPRHGPAWHLGLVGSTGVGLAFNMWWLWDWGKFWWLRQPSVDDLALFPTWGAMLRSTPENLALLGPVPFGWPLAIIGFGCCLGLIALKRRSSPALFAFTGLLAVIVARLGQVWPPFINGDAERAAPLAAVMACLPVAGVVSAWTQRAALGLPLVLSIVAMPLLLTLDNVPARAVRDALHLQLAPLPLGFTQDQEEFIRGLQLNTTAEARILLEDVTPESRIGWNWTALLPTRMDRSFLGGLDPDARFEHAFCGLSGSRLNGRSLSEWTDAELHEFTWRYNVGWVACRTPETLSRWQRLAGATVVGHYRDDGDVTLVKLERNCSFILFGSAKWEQADRKKVVLTDVIPADAPHPDGGPIPAKVIVLSLHYQAGLKVSPNIVTVERVPSAHDPIPMVRLRMHGPLSRVVLSWENR
ncbi:hypothetical protein BH11PLA2_BH11PLA2_11370 [soil metagenome]